MARFALPREGARGGQTRGPPSTRAANEERQHPGHHRSNDGSPHDLRPEEAAVVGATAQTGSPCVRIHGRFLPLRPPVPEHAPQPLHIHAGDRPLNDVVGLLDELRENGRGLGRRDLEDAR